MDPAGINVRRFKIRAKDEETQIKYAIYNQQLWDRDEAPHLPYKIFAEDRDMQEMWRTKTFLNFDQQAFTRAEYDEARAKLPKSCEDTDNFIYYGEYVGPTDVTDSFSGLVPPQMQSPASEQPDDVAWYFGQFSPYAADGERMKDHTFTSVFDENPIANIEQTATGETLAIYRNMTEVFPFDPSTADNKTMYGLINIFVMMSL